MLLAGFAWLTGLLDDPAALTAHPAAADVEHLHRGFEFVVGERDHVGVGAVAEHHRLLLQRALAARRCRHAAGPPSRSRVLGGLVHLLFHVADQPVGLTGQEVAEVQHDLAVLVGADPADARRRALVDVARAGRAGQSGCAA